MKTIIILVGGLGSRLKSISGDLPKPMLLVESRPFLERLMNFLKGSASQFVLSTGYKADVISSHFGECFQGVPVKYSQENSPLGTGGAIKRAMETFQDDNFFVINGDTFFNIRLKEMAEAQLKNQAIMCMALKPMKQFERYGNVKLRNGKILGFEEKKFTKDGFINGGVYMLNREICKFFPRKERFSFEKDVLEKHINELNIFPYISDTSFIDIGIPEDYFSIENNSGIFRS
jgi:D-glycero-alpha-D-manno-heptose 1-phosphate guanylyltransferase